jgi:hypothetical protein
MCNKDVVGAKQQEWYQTSAAQERSSVVRVRFEI